MFSQPVAQLVALPARAHAGASPSNADSGMLAWSSVTVHAVVERASNSVPLVVALGLGQLAILLLLGVLLVRHLRLKEQLLRLTETAAAISRGDRHARATLSGGPLAEFGDTFDDMATLLTNEIRDLRATQRELEQLVATDRLTGVGNRRQFEQHAELEVARAKRYGIPVSLLLFDVDNFKRINDTYGHQMGDAVLVNLARRVATRLRDTDSIARWGGEEFAILATCTTISGAEVLAESIRCAVASGEFDVVGLVTISLGVAQLRPSETTAQWIARADELLYEAKRAGRNRVNSTWHHDEQSMSFVLVWGDQFLVHHPSIDAQHAEIFRLTNELVLSPKDSRSSEILERFDALFNHVSEHFRTEESFLADRGCGSLELEQHAQLHHGILAQAAGLRRRLLEGSIEVSEVGDFVVRRIAVGHLLNADLPLFASLVPSATLPVQDKPRPTMGIRIHNAVSK